MVLFSSEKSNEVASAIGTPDGAKSENEHIWDHPWTTNEIRKNSGNWTLAGDVGLLNYLKEFSHKLISRTHEMEKVVDSLVHKSKVASVKVSNVINDFQMLSNLQFVENRVYDEEAIDPEPTQAVEVILKSKEQKEAEMVPKIRQALELGISVLDKAFERIDVDETSESEDDEDNSRGRTVLEPKDLYEHRPLPFIIGSTEFDNDDFVGLRYMNEEDVSMELSTQDVSVSTESEVESEVESEDEEVTKPADQRDHKSTKSSVDTILAKGSEDSDSSDLFDAEEEEVDSGFLPEHVVKEQPQAIKTDSLIDELKRKTKSSGDQPDAVQAEKIEKPVAFKKPEKAHTEEDLFSAGDTFFKDEDDESPFCKKTGLFSSNGPFDIPTEGKRDNLFDDDDVEEISPPPAKVTLVSEKNKDKIPSAKTTKPPAPAATKTDNSSKFLFDDDDDDSDHDLFSNLSKPSIAKKQQVLTATNERVNKSASSQFQQQQKTFDVHADIKSSSLFGESDSDDNDLFSTPSKTKQNDFHLDVGNEDDDDLFSAKPTTTSTKSESKVIEPKKEIAKSSLLFEDTDSFDLFSPKSKVEVATAIAAEKPIISIKSKPTSLFDDSLDESDLFGQPEKVEEKLIKHTGKSKENEVPAKSLKLPKVLPEIPAKVAPKNISTAKMDDADGNILDRLSKAKSLFDESLDEDDLFGQTAKIAESVKQTKKPKITKKKVEISAKPQKFPKVLPQLPVKVDADKSSPFKIEADIVREKSLFGQQDSTSEGAPFGESLDFGQSSNETGRLTALNKDRVKGQAKRRKPTRKGRQLRIETETAVENHLVSTTSQQDDLFPSKSSPTAAIEKPNAVPTTKVSQNTYKKTEQSKKDLMSQLISEATTSKIVKRKSFLEIDTVEDDTDLFSSTVASNKPIGSGFSFSPESDKDAIFDTVEPPETNLPSLSLSDSTSDDDDLFSDIKKNTMLGKSDPFDDDYNDDDDDIFKQLTKVESFKKSPRRSSDDDDIFAGVDEKKYEVFPTQASDEEDDDDIFSNVVKPKISAKSSTTKKSQDRGKSEVLFNDPLGGLSCND